MRVLHTLPTVRPEYGGPAQSVPGLVRALRTLGIDAELWTSDGSRPEAGFDDVPICSKTLPNALRQIPRLALIHDHGIWRPIHHQIASLAHHMGLPRIVSPRGMLEQWSLQQRRLKKRIAWLLYQRRDLVRAACLHGTSKVEVSQFRKLGLGGPTVMVPNGVHLPHRDSTGRLSLATRQGHRTALFLSRMDPKKGLPMLLDAWARVRPRDWRLLIAGSDDGGHAKVVAKKIELLGLREEVQMIGVLEGSAKEQAYRSAHLFILPSFSENFGMVVAEALSYELPVLTTRGCPWSELESNSCGWWVEATTDGIETGLRSALSRNDAELQEMGSRGYNLAATRYGWPAIAREMSKTYEGALHER